VPVYIISVKRPGNLFYFLHMCAVKKNSKEHGY
jgi:hypothetical protein